VAFIAAPDSVGVYKKIYKKISPALLIQIVINSLRQLLDLSSFSLPWSGD
jgi:hypothetical protein